MYGGERVGWWRQTVNTSVHAVGGACSPPPPTCPPPRAAAAGGRRGQRRRPRAGRALREAAVGSPPRRRLRNKPVRYDQNTPPVPGTPCLPPPPHDADAASLERSLFAGYLQLQHVRHAEVGRLQRWRCSWVYMLRACLEAERLLRAQALRAGEPPPAERCRRIAPPDHGAAHGAALGWGGVDVSSGADLNPLLYQLRCW